MIPNLKLLSLSELNSYKLRVLESIKILPNVQMFKNLLNLVEKEIKHKCNNL